MYLSIIYTLKSIIILISSINLIKNNYGICNTFNKYFVNVGSNIENNIKVTGYNYKPFTHINAKCEITDSIFIEPISSLEVENYLNKIKEHSSYFESKLTNFILIKVSKSISVPLAYLFNLAIALDSFPSNFKICVMYSLYKSGQVILQYVVIIVQSHSLCLLLKFLKNA